MLVRYLLSYPMVLYQVIVRLNEHPIYGGICDVHISVHLFNSPCSWLRRFKFYLNYHTIWFLKQVVARLMLVVL